MTTTTMADNFFIHSWAAFLLHLFSACLSLFSVFRGCCLECYSWSRWMVSRPSLLNLNFEDFSYKGGADNEQQPQRDKIEFC